MKRSRSSSPDEPGPSKKYSESSRKREEIFLSSEDETEPLNLTVKPRPSSSTVIKKEEKPKRVVPKPPAAKQPSCDLNLDNEPSSSSQSLPPYSIFLGSGIMVEIKAYRKEYYVAFSRQDNGETKNRFNINIKQLPVLKKAVEALRLYCKEHKFEI